MSPQKIEMSLPYIVKAIAQPPIRLLSKAVDDIPESIINSQFNMISNRLCIPMLLKDYPHYDQLKEKYNSSSKVTEALIDETKHVLKELRSLLELRNEDVINRNRGVINTYLKAKQSIDTKPLSFVIEAPTMNNIMTVTANIPAIDQVVINSTMVNPENVTITIHTKQAKNDIYKTRNDKRFEQIVTMPIDNDIITTDDIYDNKTNETQNNNNDNDDKQECIVPKVLIPGVLPLPKSIASVITNRNFRTEDDPTMRFIPYFGETDTSGIEVGGELYNYVPGGNDFEVSGEAEELTIYHLLTKHGYIIQESPDNDDDDNEEVDYTKNAKKEVLTALSHVLKISEKNIIVSFKKVSQGKRDLELSSSNSEINAARVQRLGSSVFLPIDGPAPPIFSNSEKYKNNAGIRNVDSYDHLIDNYKDYFCRRCYTYYCTLHGIQQPQPFEKKKAPAPPLCPVPYLKLPSDLIRRPHLSSKTSLDSSDNNNSSNSISSTSSNNNKANMSNKKPDTVKNVSSVKGSNWVDDFAPRLLASSTDHSDGTSNKLPPYNINAVEDANYLDKISFKLYGNANTSVKNLEEYEKALITKFHSILPGKTEKKVEMITKVLGTRIKPEVELYLEYLNQKPILCQPVVVKKKWTQEKKKSRSDKKKVATKVLEYEPCRHDGPCDDECPCVNNDGNFGGFCERYCACSSECSSRFQGCHCKNGCSTSACPCFKADRECDPDLCHDCGASIHPMYLPLVKEHLKKHKEKYEVKVASNEYSSVLPTDEGVVSQLEKSKKVASYKICSNANITRGSRDNKIGVGRSTIHGWGAFLKNDVNASEFLMEYGGEIISQDEAERRGRIYDKVDSSYLFSLNDEMAVDATRLGSKTKFINHASQPNCEPKIMLVKGEHKIAFFAKESMTAGQELTFDYGYNNESSPNWKNTKFLKSSSK